MKGDLFLLQILQWCCTVERNWNMQYLLMCFVLILESGRYGSNIKIVLFKTPSQVNDWELHLLEVNFGSYNCFVPSGNNA